MRGKGRTPCLHKKLYHGLDKMDSNIIYIAGGLILIVFIWLAVISRKKAEIAKKEAFKIKERYETNKK